MLFQIDDWSLGNKSSYGRVRTDPQYKAYAYSQYRIGRDPKARHTYAESLPVFRPLPAILNATSLNASCKRAQTRRLLEAKPSINNIKHQFFAFVLSVHLLPKRLCKHDDACGKE